MPYAPHFAFAWPPLRAPPPPPGFLRPAVAPLAGLLTIQPEVSRGANKPASTVGTAAKICENTVYKFTVVAGPFPAESCECWPGFCGCRLGLCGCRVMILWVFVWLGAC